MDYLTTPKGPNGFREASLTSSANDFSLLELHLDDDDHDEDDDDLHLHKSKSSISEVVDEGGADLPLWKLAVVTSTWIGIQCIWTTEFSITQPYMEYLSTSVGFAALTWIWGPITGFVVAPLIGAASDRCESMLGRRRPFMIAGLLFLMFFSFLFASSEKFFGRTTTGSIWALIMFIGMDATINVMQTPVRALVSDLTSSRQQAMGQLMSAGFQGFGGLCGALIMVPYADRKSENVLPVFAIASGVNCTLIMLACFFSKETPYKRPDYLRKPGSLEPFKQVFTAVRYMPHSLIRIAIVQFFSWIGLFLTFTYKVTWWGKVVYGGCVKVGDGCTEEGIELYNKGLKMNDQIDVFANIGQLFLGIFLSLILQHRHNVHLRYLYAFMIAVGAGSFFALHLLNNLKGVGQVVFTLFCIPNAAINSMPFALVGAYNRAQTEKENDTGVQMGVLNLFIVIPQVIVIGVSSAFQDAGLGGSLFFMVAVSWTLAAIAALFVQDRFKNNSLTSIDIRESMVSDRRSRPSHL